MAKKFLFFASIALAVFTLSGCITIKSGTSTVIDGGMFKSIDKGEKWTQVVAIPTTTGQKASMASVDVNVIAPDPSDSKAIYIGTFLNGMYFTYDSGASWYHVASLGNKKINSIAIDPAYNCTIYTAIGSQIFKSLDCTRTFNGVYNDPRANTQVYALAADPKDSSVIWAGTSNGDILKSTNYGKSWSSLYLDEKKNKLPSAPVKILIDPNDSRIAYVATLKSGLYKTEDGGASWKDLNAGLKAFSGYNTFSDMDFDRSNKGTLILACSYGLLKTTDGGNTWAEIKLVSQPKTVQIFSVAVNPANGDEIYYTTNNTFFKTINGGTDWQTKKLPSTRAGYRLLIDKNNSSIIYLGVKKLEDQSSGLFF